MIKIQQFDTDVPIYSWCPDIEPGALEQMALISKLSFVKHCALMPDAHQGMDMPIGGVVACEGVIVPSFVGVDIGCGMMSMKTSIERETLRGKECHLLSRLSALVPVGFAHNSPEVVAYRVANNRYPCEVDDNIPVDQSEDVLEAPLTDMVCDQLGTLGGGNHFLELQTTEANRVAVMVHSGSRNIGKRVCDHFTSIAKRMNARWRSDSTIPFLPVDSDEGRDYLAWMNFCLWFSQRNKEVMLDLVRGALKELVPEVIFADPMVIHHNYAALENHMGRNWWVHRKGAISAKNEQVGIIPGSMGTPSYLTRGLGNVLSLNSCSHGAGRRMGRSDFNRSIDSAEKRDEVAKSLEGVVYRPFEASTRTKKGERALIDCSEAPGAYKDIDTVMKNQEDLVQPIIKLKPFLCLKG